MGVGHVQDVPHPLVLLLQGGGLPGQLLHLGDLGPQGLVFGGQGLILEHVAVEILGLGGQGVAGEAEGRQDALDQQPRNALPRDAAQGSQARRQQHRHHQQDPDLHRE